VYETDVEINAYIYEWALINMVYGIDNLTNKEHRGVRKPKPVVLSVVPPDPPSMPPQKKHLAVMNDILDADEVAKLLRLNEQTVKRLANRGELPGFKIGGRWRFRREAIEEYIRKLEQQQGGQKQED
jgi:excisionase family DNA binding protein